MEKILYIEQYGAKGDGRHDCTRAFQEALKDAAGFNGRKIIKFGAGHYLISKALEVSDVNDITVEGCGVSTILLQNSPKFGGIWVSHCENILVKGFAFDMISLPYCEGIVTESGSDFVVMTVSSGFEDTFEAKWFMNYRQNFGSVVRGTGDEHHHLQDVVWYKGFERLSKDKWKVNLLADGGTERCGVVKGDGIYFLSRGGENDATGKNAAFYVTNSKNITMGDLTVYAGSSVAMALRNNENIKVNNYTVRERPGRMISTNADGIHASDNRGFFEIGNCSFEGMCDDGINVFTRHRDIIKVLSSTELLMSSDFACCEGETLQVVDVKKKRRVKGESTIAKCEKINTGVYVRLEKPIENMIAGKTVMRETDGVEMTANGDQVYVHEACGNLHIHDCFFGRYRGRGILAHSNALIENNVFGNNSACAIHLTEDCDWPEGPVPKNIVVKNNKFICGTPVPRQPLISVEWICNDGYLRNISIENNEFAGHIVFPAIFVKNTDDVKINGNTFEEKLTQNEILLKHND